jgi:hypothetical protein
MPIASASGYYPSHASLRVKILGLPVDVKEAAWKCSVERSEVRVNAREAIAHTIGDVKYEFSMTVFRPQWEKFKADCRARGYRVLDTPGDAVLTTGERGFAAKSVQVKFSGMTESDASSSAGPDAHEVKVTFSTLSIKEDGQAMIERAVW